VSPKASKGDAFTAAAISGAPRSRMSRIDKFLESMTEEDACRIRSVLMDNSISHRQCAAGFAAIDKRIAVSAVGQWRRDHGFQ